MLTVCSHGVFVGVRRFRGLGREQWLRSDSDACRVREYLLRASGTCGSRWRLVTKGRRKEVPPGRLDVLGAVKRLVADVGRGSAGIFYFAGHAEVGRKGLLLRCFDSSDDHLEDSALSLGRVLRELKARAGDGVRFLVILDCCREGGEGRVSDDVPANVCVIYACAGGGRAREDAQGGVLTAAILDSLGSAWRSGAASSLTVRGLCNWMGRESLEGLDGWPLRFECVGGNGSSIALPVGPKDGGLQGEGPRVRLRYAFEGRKELEAGVGRLWAGFMRWYGISPDDRDGVRFVKAHFRRGRDTDIVDVRIPGNGLGWSSAECVQQLLGVVGDGPTRLLVTWPGSVALERLKGLRHRLDEGEWHELEGVEGHALRWKNDTGEGVYRGTLILEQARLGTTVVVKCDTGELFDMPLEYLMPSLMDVYVDLVRLRCERVGR